MDMYQVPKKVNRHVLKAVSLLSSENVENGSVTISQIINQVKNQMKKLVPVANIDMVIQKSLKNLSDIGLISRTGPKRFSISGNSFMAPSEPNSNARKGNKNLFKPSGSRKRSTSNLDPNTRRGIQYDSEDSLSGDNYDGARKRLRTNNKKLLYAGRKTELPKSKQHQGKTLALRKSYRKTAYDADSAENYLETSTSVASADHLNGPNYTSDAFTQHPPEFCLAEGLNKPGNFTSNTSANSAIISEDEGNKVSTSSAIIYQAEELTKQNSARSGNNGSTNSAIIFWEEESSKKNSDQLNNSKSSAVSLKT